jgi:hypothetical protein
VPERRFRSLGRPHEGGNGNGNGNGNGRVAHPPGFVVQHDQVRVPTGGGRTTPGTPSRTEHP